MIRAYLANTLATVGFYLTTVIFACCPPSAAGADDIIDFPMYKSPDLPIPRVEMVFPEGAKALWFKALESPEAEMRCNAADAIARARLRGVGGLEAAIGPLLAMLNNSDERSSVRLAGARALVALEAKEAASSLFRHAQTGDSDLRDVVEPALARWDYQPARAVWLTRLRDSSPRARGLMLAIQGLATVREKQAVEPLRALAFSERVNGSVRLEAATALGILCESGLENDAEQLAGDNSPAGISSRLAAVSLLARHESESAIRVLQRLLRDAEPAVGVRAGARLFSINSKLLLPSLEYLLTNPDAKLRSHGVEVLFREPTEKHITLLAVRLDDVEPGVRIQARKALHELSARKEFRESILAEAMKALRTRQWRGLEQASVLLAQLDHKPAAPRLVELLEFDRAEVFVAAAWGLRKLAVRETLPAVTKYVEAIAKQLPGSTGRPIHRATPPQMIDHQLAQLNQFLGQQKHAPADATLRVFIPRASMRQAPIRHESRAAAVWALGLIHEGKSNPELTDRVLERLNDSAGYPPEDFRVRWISALTLGRLRADNALPRLRFYFVYKELSDDRVNNACGWAIQQIAGEQLPPVKTIRKTERDWFLTPNQ